MAVDHVFVPPIKTQGIKTKLVPLIRSIAEVDEDTVWVEPFMGSGVVGFNVAPRRAVFADTNPHLIAVYTAIQRGVMTAANVREYLEREGAELARRDDAYYYEVRDRFNERHDPFDFLFLNRSCFNGMIRFNRQGGFNVPYGHKPQRFAKAYITKIVNQVAHVQERLACNDWTFVEQSFEATIEQAPEESFIYCDPPYIGRHVDYYDSWDESREIRLHELLMAHKGRFMLSTWDHNRYRSNPYLDSLWSDCRKTTKDHFYHVGARQANRSSMVEALLTNYEPDGPQQEESSRETSSRGTSLPNRDASSPSAWAEIA